jgi:hypothetical protein
VIAVATGPSPQALAVTLAAQALGGTAIWLDPEAGGTGTLDGARLPETRFGFARDDAALIKLRARLGRSDAWTLGLHTAEHGSPDDPTAPIRSYAAAASSGAPGGWPEWARPEDGAFLTAPEQGGAGPSVLTHAQLIDAARLWLAGAEDVVGRLAFTAEAPRTDAVATFFAAWLVGGFSLALPEDASTANLDRRELQPSIIAATGTAYGRLARKVADQLPPPDTLLRRALDVGLATPGRWGEWAVRRPLREVLGLARVRTALVLGAPSSEAAQSLFGSLGIALRAWPDGGSGKFPPATPAEISPPAFAAPSKLALPPAGELA